MDQQELLLPNSTSAIGVYPSGCAPDAVWVRSALRLERVEHVRVSVPCSVPGCRGVLMMSVSPAGWFTMGARCRCSGCGGDYVTRPAIDTWRVVAVPRRRWWEFPSRWRRRVLALLDLDADVLVCGVVRKSGAEES